MTKLKWYPCGTNFPGVRYRKHATRKYGVSFDKYFSIRYQLESKQREESLGWASAGMTAVRASEIRAQLMRNIRKGEGHSSLKNQRKAKKKKNADEKSKSLSVSDFFYNFYMTHSDNLAKKSLSTEETKFRRHIEPAIGKRTIWNLSTLDVERVKKSLTERKFAPRTILYSIQIIHRMINIARTLKKFPADRINPASSSAGVKRPKLNNARIRIFSLEEIEEIITRCKGRKGHGYDLPLMIRFSFHSGVRAGDLWKIQWQHISKDLNSIIILDTKNGESRTISVSKTTRNMLSKLKRGENDEYLFKNLSNEGHPLTEVPVLFRQIIKEMGLNKGITDRRMLLSFHSLLHTASTILAQNGVGAEDRQKFRAHKSIAMAQRYNHHQPGNQVFHKILDVGV